MDIDRTLVAKQSIVKFELKTEALTAGRPKTTSFVLVIRFQLAISLTWMQLRLQVQALIQLMMKPVIL